MVVEHLLARRPKAEPSPAPDHSHSDAYVVGFSDGLTQATRDLAITHAHRTLLRRILASEPIGDLGHILGALYLHGLVEDDMVNRLPFVTPLGVELLAAHDRLAATVRRERPRLTSRPMPAGWVLVGDTYAHAFGELSLGADASDDEDLEIAIQYAHAIGRAAAMGASRARGACSGRCAVSPTRCTAHSDRSGLWLIRRELRPYGVGCAWFLVAMVFVPAVPA